MKQGMDRGRKNSKLRVADMSLPAEERGRRRKGKGRGNKGILAQMNHGNKSEATKRRRKWEKQEAQQDRATLTDSPLPEEQDLGR